MKRHHWARAFLNASALTVATLAVTIECASLAYRLTPGQGTWDHPGPWVDWQTYAAAFNRMISGSPIYAPQQLSGPYLLTHVVLIGYAYPPASVPLFAPFLSYPFGLAGWLTINIGLMVTSAWALASRAWPQNRSLVFAIWLAGLAFFLPFVDGVVSANVSVGLAGMVGWIAVGAGPKASAAFGVLGAVTKIFAGATALATSERKSRALMWALAGTGILALLTLPFVRPVAWSDFVRALAAAQPDCGPFNSSLACVLAPSMGPKAGTLIGLAAGAAAALGLFVVRVPFWMALLAAVALMAPATNLWPHYWNSAYVLLLAAVAELVRVRRNGGVRGRPQSPSRS